MKRFPLVAALAAMVLSGGNAASAQDAITEQIEAAHRTFMLGLDRDSMYEGEYFETLVEGIEGTWAGVRAWEDEADRAAAVAQTCGRFPITIALAPPLSLTFAIGPEGKSWNLSLIYKGGAVFATRADTGSYLDQLGFAERLDEGTGRQSAIIALYGINSDALVYRPSADVLVLVRPNGWPEIYARCPVAAVPQGQDTSALDDAIIKEFDEQFGSVEEGVREAFVPCAREAMSAVSDEDVALMIATGFDPPASEVERIEKTYPEASAAMAVCAEAAEAAMR